MLGNTIPLPTSAYCVLQAPGTEWGTRLGCSGKTEKGHYRNDATISAIKKHQTRGHTPQETWTTAGLGARASASHPPGHLPRSARWLPGALPPYPESPPMPPGASAQNAAPPGSLPEPKVTPSGFPGTPSFLPASVGGRVVFFHTWEFFMSIYLHKEYSL